MRNKLIFLLLLVILMINPLSEVIKRWDSFVARDYHTKYEELKYAYYHSQYTTKRPTVFVLDQTLESFMGGIFLTGISPILVHHDQPPLGRYIIALSIAVFDNEKTIPLLLIMISAIGIYLVAFEVLKNKFLALIPFGIFINQLMFTHKFTYIPLLEPIQFPFIIFAIYFFMRGVEKKKYLPWFLATAVMIGFVISIRFFVLGMALAGALGLYLVLKKRIRQAVIFTASLLISVVILLATYFQTFMGGYSLIKVLGIQKYILVYHKSAFTESFTYWDLLLFNRWHTWWGDRGILSDKEWTIFWPICVGIIVVFLVLLFYKKVKISSEELILLLWLGVYSTMLSVGYTSTRYFLPLIPFLYIVATSFAVKMLAKINRSKYNKVIRRFSQDK